MLLSVGGAMVSLVGGEWVEVRTLVLGAIDEAELEREVKAVYDGTYDHPFIGDFDYTYPEVISDMKGNILTEVYRRLCKEPDFDPDTVLYSYERETLTALWLRENWRWIPE